MPNTLQEFLADATRKAAADLIEAMARIPEDKRDWSPEPSSRSAVDLVAECAILNGYTADLIMDRVWPSGGFEIYMRDKAAAAALPPDQLNAMLKENAEKVIATFHTVPADELKIEIQMPWGPQPLSEIISYPFWNMSYHLGQVNYIASILGVLE